MKVRGLSFDKDTFIKNLDNKITIIKNRFKRYIESVIEIKSDNDNFSLYGEVMVYAPNGFVVSAEKL